MATTCGSPALAHEYLTALPMWEPSELSRELLPAELWGLFESHQWGCLEGKPWAGAHGILITEQSGLGRRRVVGGGVCGTAGMEEFSKVCFLAELLQNKTLGFNLARLGLFAESWAFVCSLMCLDWELRGFSSALSGIAASRSNLDYPFFHGRWTGKAVTESWAHPGCSAAFPSTLQGPFNCFHLFLLLFFFFSHFFNGTFRAWNSLQIRL